MYFGRPVFASVLTTFFFALSVTVARRSASYVGAQPANLCRLLIALAVMALYAHTVGQGLQGKSFPVLFLSGVVGFGLGDWALFEALPRIGASMTILLCQCLAAPIGALVEWLWLGTHIGVGQVLSSAIILLGVALAIAPEKDSEIPVGHRWAGGAFGVLAAAGQAVGAVLSRYAFLQAGECHFQLDELTATYQRLWGGLISLAALFFVRYLFSSKKPSAPGPVRDWVGGWPWIVSNALAGPVIGVSCYMQALKEQPSNVVLPIVATTPLFAMILTFMWDGNRPSARAIAGSFMAVMGVVLLVRSG